MTAQAIKRHGGKSYLAEKIIELMPPRTVNSHAPAADDAGWCHFVEPFFGGGSVLFAMNPAGIGEVVNDLDGELTNFWRVLQDLPSFEQFTRLVESIPCSQVEFEDARKQIESLAAQWPDGRIPEGVENVKRAAWFFVINRQSRQALGRVFSTLAKTRTRRGMNELPSAWLSAIEGLPEIHARLKRVVILHDDALKIIRQQDGPRTLFYLDPPYLHETRATTGEYQHEMTEQHHAALLDVLERVQGRFLLSGYHSPLYDRRATAAGWRCAEFKIDNKAGGGKEKRQMIECVWMNY